MWPQHLPLGRPCIALVFAAMACGLREFCHKAWPEEDYPSLDFLGKINPTPIGLLFGLMLVNAYLSDTGLWKHVDARSLKQELFLSSQRLVGLGLLGLGYFFRLVFFVKSCRSTHFLTW